MLKIVTLIKDNRKEQKAISVAILDLYIGQFWNLQRSLEKSRYGTQHWNTCALVHVFVNYYLIIFDKCLKRI